MGVNRNALIIAVIVGTVVHVVATMVTTAARAGGDDRGMDMLILILSLLLFVVYGLVYAVLADRAEHSGAYTYGGGITGALSALGSWIVLAVLMSSAPSSQEFPGAYVTSLCLGGLVITMLGTALGAGGGALFSSLSNRRQAA